MALAARSSWSAELDFFRTHAQTRGSKFASWVVTDTFHGSLRDWLGVEWPFYSCTVTHGTAERLRSSPLLLHNSKFTSEIATLFADYYYYYLLLQKNVFRVKWNSKAVTRALYKIKASCLHHLLPSPRNTSPISRLHIPLPRQTSHTKKFQSFVNVALNKYQSPL